jgi:hypothetical protein
MSDAAIPLNPPENAATRLNGQLAKKAQEYHDGGGFVPVAQEHLLYTDSSDIQGELAPKVANGKANAEDIYRAYKNTPHSPIAMLGKYIVHRINNLDSYETPQTAEELDHKFMALHKYGKASAKNGHISTRDLHSLAAYNPKLIEDMVKTRDRLQDWIKRGCGLNTKVINGEHYVALTRGLNSHVMAHEHALSSCADLPHSRFGSHQHNMWAPLKDVWFTFMAGSKHSRGTFGHENEILLSNQGTRYDANPEDVTPTIFKPMDPRLFDPHVINDWVPAVLGTATRTDIRHLLTTRHVLLDLRDHFRTNPHKISPEIAKELLDLTQDASMVLGSSAVSRETAIQYLGVGSSSADALAAVKNPNLDESDLIKTLDSKVFAETPSFPQAITKHPKFNETVAKAMLAAVIRNATKFVGQASCLEKIVITHALCSLMESGQPPKQLKDVLLSNGDTGVAVWDVIAGYRGTKINDVINTDFTDKLMAAFAYAPAFYRSFPMSDAAFQKTVGALRQLPLDCGRLMGENPFLTERHIAILGASKASYQLFDLAFNSSLDMLLKNKKMAREEIFRFQSDDILYRLAVRLEENLQDDWIDDLTDAEIVKTGKALRRFDSRETENKFIHDVIRWLPPTRLRAWANLVEDPKDVYKLVSAQNKRRSLSSVYVNPKDSEIARVLAIRIASCSRDSLEDPSKHLLVPLPKDI